MPVTPLSTRPLEATHYWYDGRSLLIRASNQAALVEFERDGNGRIVGESVNGRRVESKLDARGNRIERRIGRGEVGEGLVRYAHDPLGLVASITVDDHTPLAFTRDALGRETSRASPKGFRLDQSWDAVDQVTTQSAGHGAFGLAGLNAFRAPPASGTAAERHYAWDKAGAPVGIDDLIWGETRYSYDANSQVAEASFGDGFTEKFDYDSAKNVAGVKLQGPEIGPGLGGLLSWQSTPGGVVQLARGPNGETIALTHDICGRVVTRRVDRKGFRPKTWRYGWDMHDRLVSCETPDGDTWFYRYGPFGRRLTKVRKLREAELAWTAQKFSALVSEDAREKTKIWTWPEPPDGAGGPSDACAMPIESVRVLATETLSMPDVPNRLATAEPRSAPEPASAVPASDSGFEGETTPDCTDWPAPESTPTAPPAIDSIMPIADDMSPPSPPAAPDSAPLTALAASPPEPPATPSAWPSMPDVIPAMPISGAINAAAPAPVPPTVRFIEPPTSVVALLPIVVDWLLPIEFD